MPSHSPTQRLRRIGLVFSLLLVLSTLWLSRHSLLAQPAIFKASHSITHLLGLPTLAAQRPELLHIVSHGRFSNQDNNSELPFILGQLYNPTLTSLQTPSIKLVLVDKDNNVISSQQFSPAEWQARTPLMASHALMDFQIQLQNAPAASWGYRIQLAD